MCTTFKDVPQYRIDLDVEPQLRWKHIMEQNDMGPKITALKDTLLYLLRAEFGRATWFIQQWSKTGMNIHARDTLPAEYLQELAGIAECTSKHGLHYDQLLQLNMGYSYLAACTSAVVCPSGEEFPVHLRNMDWEDHNDALRNATIEVVFQKGGKDLYVATTWLGCVSVFTGMTTPGDNTAWSVSLNYRKINGNIANNLIQCCKGGAVCGSGLIRQALETCGDYQTAVTKLTKGTMDAPAYLTVCGCEQSQGIVLERDRVGAHAQFQLTDSQRFVAITNNDHGVTEVSKKWTAGDPLLINTIERQQAIEAELYALCADTHEQHNLVDDQGRIATLPPVAQKGMASLATEPVMNYQTVYTVVALPALGTYYSFVPVPSQEEQANLDKLNPKVKT
eukprot:TRINITY_DN112774_c0_g1_i1.p1 TRINITY_DN112774_c0_g1~~TRINITY_DN112774_c0_g1_i1.p1  ORF type:complete len:393 (+),score=34.38 TRINITY_DN112774_c0_g1_i1:34-1212(+)